MSVRNILDGTIKVGSGEVMPVEPEIPENLQVTTLKASQSVMAGDTVIVGTSRGNTTITSAAVTTQSLILGGNQVLGVQTTNAKMTMTGLKADGKTPVSFESTTDRWLYNIYPDLHMLVMVFSITTEPLSQLTIPTGLSCGSTWWGKTLLKTDNDQFIDCVMQLSAIDGKLVIKIDIPTASSYAGLFGKISIPFF